MGHRPGLYVAEIDLTNEINLQDFTISARMIYDLNRGFDLPGAIRNYLIQWQTDTGRATYSVGVDRPNIYSDPPHDCNSVYGRSARLGKLDNLAAAIDGHDYFGRAWGFVADGDLSCGGLRTESNGLLWMTQIPVYYTRDTNKPYLDGVPPVVES